MLGGVSCVIPLGIPVASTGHARGAAFSFGREGRQSGRGNERVLMSDKAKRNEQMDRSKQTEIVKSVLYAVVISVWATVVVDHHNAVMSFLESVKDVNTHAIAFLSVGLFAYITLYFHDEWKYGKCKKYVKENTAVICWGWSFFIFQACLLGHPIWPSSACGIIGVIIITVGLFCAPKGQMALKIRLAVENILWILSLILICIAECTSDWLVWFSLSPILITICRVIIPCGLPKIEIVSDRVHD